MESNALWLVRKDVNTIGQLFLFTFLIVVVLGFFSPMQLNQFIIEVWHYSFILDLIFIGQTPSFAALFMSGPYLTFQTIKTAPYSKKIGFYHR